MVHAVDGSFMSSSRSDYFNQRSPSDSSCGNARKCGTPSIILLSTLKDGWLLQVRGKVWRWCGSSCASLQRICYHYWGSECHPPMLFCTEPPKSDPDSLLHLSVAVQLALHRHRLFAVRVIEHMNLNLKSAILWTFPLEIQSKIERGMALVATTVAS